MKPNIFTLTFKVLLAFALTGPLVAVRASTLAEDLKTKVDENVAKHFQNESQVGVVVGVIRGSEVHFWNYGETSRGSGNPVDADTYFEMGSITKTYTATLLALEVEKGTLSLQDPIGRYWKELDGTDAGKITFQELATHTSGLPRMPLNFVETDPLDPYKDYDAALLYQFLKDFRHSAPGSFPYEYSNVGIGTLGYVLSEKINAKTFADYLEDSLLKPLGLSATKTRLTSINLTKAAQGYDSFFSPMPFWNLNVLEGAGVLKTTARDLLRFLDFNMNADASLLGRAMNLAHQQLAPTSSPEETVGLVWAAQTLGRHSVITHSGATGGYRANLIFDKSEKLGVVILSNTDVSPTCVVAPVFDVPCEIPKFESVKASTIAKLVGKFESVAIGMKAEVFQQGGHLGIHPEGQAAFKLWAKSQLEYAIPDAKAGVIFLPSPTGDVDQFELKQGGQSFVFKRL